MHDLGVEHAAGDADEDLQDHRTLLAEAARGGRVFGFVAVREIDPRQNRHRLLRRGRGRRGRGRRCERLHHGEGRDRGLRRRRRHFDVHFRRRHEERGRRVKLRRRGRGLGFFLRRRRDDLGLDRRRNHLDRPRRQARHQRAYDEADMDEDDERQARNAAVAEIVVEGGQAHRAVAGIDAMGKGLKSRRRASRPAWRGSGPRRPDALLRKPVGDPQCLFRHVGHSRRDQFQKGQSVRRVEILAQQIQTFDIGQPREEMAPLHRPILQASARRRFLVERFEEIALRPWTRSKGTSSDR